MENTNSSLQEKSNRDKKVIAASVMTAVAVWVAWVILCVPKDQNKTSNVIVEAAHRDVTKILEQGEELEILRAENERLKKLLVLSEESGPQSLAGDLWSGDSDILQRAIREQINPDGTINLKKWGFSTEEESDFREL